MASFRSGRGLLVIIAIVFTLVTISLGIYPETGLAAAKEGLKIFWEIVFPSLLPFFVLSEILLGLGVVNAFGVLLEPLMRPVFNVPGAGAFALSMGLAAGYPMDAVITGKFRRSGLCTRVEGERLLAFTNTADPLFMFGAVAVGMFGLPEVGVTIAIAHYLSAFSVGFLFRFYGRQESSPKKEGLMEGKRNSWSKAVKSRKHLKKRESIGQRALQELFRAKNQDGRHFGQLLGDAVKDSISTLFMIGGFIMVFSVFVAVLDRIGLVTLLTPIVGKALDFCGLHPSLSKALLQGILEIDLGAMAAAQTNTALDQRIVLAGVIIAWSGLCVHGQVISVIHDTDLRLAPYIGARILHALLAGIYTFFLIGPLQAGTAFVSGGILHFSAGFFDRWILSGRHFLITIGFLLVGAVLLRFLGKYRLIMVEEETSHFTDRKKPVAPMRRL